ncbi:MAG TPA: hypothetical protein VL856_19345 [Acidimicrobiia bacterium]|jgi:hypothetical protein|nr:hypothetical protein [Acidimicrobiia bacterium]
MSRRSFVALAIAIAVSTISGLVVAIPARPAHAWKPPTHLFGVEGALQDAIDDGEVTIATPDGAPPVTIAANPTIVEALRAHPEAYRAGTIGPDAYPDPIFGQASVHPDACTDNDKEPTPQPTDRCVKQDKAQTFEWLTYLWEQAWNPATPHDERLKDIAFALGYMGGHANGDMWAHAWINSYAGGVAPAYTDFPHAAILIRHLVLEGYADKHRPGAQNETTYEAAAPLNFVADKLILSDFARAHGSQPLYDFFFEMQDSLKTTEAAIDDDKSTQDTVELCLPIVGCFDVPDPTDAPINVVELASLELKDQYLEAWIDDITDGLRSFPEVSEAISQELFTGKDPDTSVITGTLKEWFLTHFLSMMGLPDFVGSGIFLVGEIIDFVTGLIADVFDGLFDLLGDIPVLSDIIGAVVDVYDEAKDVVEEKIDEIKDKICNYFVGAAFDLTSLSPELRAVVDTNANDNIECEEVTGLEKHPIGYLTNSILFPPGTREKLDADMHLKNGLDEDSTEVAGEPIILDGHDDDARGYYRDYDPELFAPLKNTNTMAKLAFLDEDGLNQFFKAKVGGDTSALGDLYPPYTSEDDPLMASLGKSTKVSWPVPNNVMLGVGGQGYIKSIDAEYQFRLRSPNDGRSYGNGTMAFWSDCVSRDRVIRKVFSQPVTGIDAFVDSADDPPKGLSDSTAPTSSSSFTGPSITTGGKTYISGATKIAITSSDDYWAKSDVTVSTRTYAAGATPPAYGTTFADPTPFSLTGADGDRLVQFFGTDGKGRCNQEAEHTLAVTLDNTPPDITVVSPTPPGPANYVSDFLLPLNFTATDPGSGVDASTRHHYADGVEKTPIPTTIDLFDYPAGIHTYRAQVADNLGNVGTKDVPWRTTVTFASLRANLNKAYSVRKCLTGDSLFKSLMIELQVSEAADLRGNDGASDLTLEAFRNDILNNIPKKITPYCGNILRINAAALQAA